MQMHRRSLWLMRWRLVKPLPLVLTLSPVFFLLYLDLLCFPCPFSLPVRSTRLSSRLAQCWQRETGTLRRLSLRTVGSGMLPRR